LVKDIEKWFDYFDYITGYCRTGPYD